MKKKAEFKKGQAAAVVLTKKRDNVEYRYYTRATIAEVTDLHYVTEEGGRFQIDTRWLVGDHTESIRIEAWSDAAALGIAKQHTVMGIRNYLQHFSALDIQSDQETLNKALVGMQNLYSTVFPPPTESEQQKS